jgi:hypothetical protein
VKKRVKKRVEMKGEERSTVKRMKERQTDGRTNGQTDRYKNRLLVGDTNREGGNKMKRKKQKTLKIKIKITEKSPTGIKLTLLYGTRFQALAQGPLVRTVKHVVRTV